MPWGSAPPSSIPRWNERSLSAGFSRAILTPCPKGSMVSLYSSIGAHRSHLTTGCGAPSLPEHPELASAAFLVSNKGYSATTVSISGLAGRRGACEDSAVGPLELELELLFVLLPLVLYVELGTGGHVDPLPGHLYLEALASLERIGEPSQ